MTEERGYIPEPCPRCKRLFVCKNDDIVHCQCASVPLNAGDRAYIAERYDKCLCADCLRALARERRKAIRPNDAEPMVHAY